MATNTDTDGSSGSKSRWMVSFWKNYEELELLINQLPNSNNTALVPQTQATTTLLKAEKKLKHVAKKLETKEQALQEIWTNDVTTVETTYIDDHGGTTTDTHSIALADLPTWTQKPVLVEEQKKGRAAGVTRKNVTGYLPPKAIDQLQGRVEHAVERIGWTPDVGTQDYAAGESEVLRHE